MLFFVLFEYIFSICEFSMKISMTLMCLGANQLVPSVSEIFIFTKKKKKFDQILHHSAVVFLQKSILI